MRDSVFIEKLALLGLAAASIAALTWIALAAMRLNGMDPNAATLIGGIATGLIAFGKDIVAAIRAYAMSAQLGKVTDQLAASGPVVDPAAPPADAAQAADQMLDASRDEAAKIKGDS